MSIVKSIVTVGLAAVCAAFMFGCSSDDANDSSSSETGVAATVNGVEIMEDTITDAIQSARDSLGLTDDD
ncbi:MAG: peptidylprolyl isomerase, partial [Eggerthellaceae bacterium]|nr:peptidylprolyl isomerase [Eggerthellaceae bacterium]